MKTCTKCKVVKSLTEFNKYSASKDGLQYKCRACANQTSKLWNENNKERHRNNTKQWRENNRENRANYNKQWKLDNRDSCRESFVRWTLKNMATISRYQFHKACKKDGIEPWMTREEFDAFKATPCLYCDGYFDTDKGWGHGMDRVDNNKPHTKENCVRCCTFCNMLRRDLLTVDETKAVIELLIKLRSNGATLELQEAA